MWCVHPHQYSSLLVMPPNCHFSPTFDSFFILSLHIMDLSNLASFLGFSMLFQLYISVLQAKPHACVLSSCSLGDHNIVSYLLHCSPFVHSSKKVFFLSLPQLIFQSFLRPTYIQISVQATEEIHHRVKGTSLIKVLILKTTRKLQLEFYYDIHVKWKTKLCNFFPTNVPVSIFICKVFSYWHFYLQL